WTSIHILFFLSALGRLASAGLAVRLHDPGARGGVPELMRSLSAPIRAALADSFVPDLVRILAFARRQRWITSSARARSDGGIVTPRARAVI
ncbi:MAG TPA: hypothetical protein VNQ54_05895, partial [Methylomirabilota bacterium]|nr:hypothetical protein [Methylomirabilota bacterium]